MRKIYLFKFTLIWLLISVNHGSLANEKIRCSGSSWNNCFATYLFSNGDQYTGEWKNNLAHGQGTYTWKSGEIYSGEWENDKFNGLGNYTDRNGNLKSGIWENGKFISTTEENNYYASDESEKLSEEEQEKLAAQEALKEKAKEVFAEVKKKAEKDKLAKDFANVAKFLDSAIDIEIPSTSSNQIIDQVEVENEVSETSIELEFWNSIKGSDDPDEYQIYLDEYPNGKFVKLAELRLKKLTIPSPSLPNLNFGKYHALVIGNDKYRHLNPLSNAVNDANDVASLLRSKYNFKVNLLTDATRDEIVSALSELRNSISSTDNLLVYYAGHGHLDTEVDEGFWLPVDAESDNQVHWVANDTVMGLVRAMQAKHVMVVADSCFSGTMTRGIKIKDNNPDYIKKIVKKKARTVLTSGGLEPVSDVGGGNNSVFASSFLNALRDNDGVLDGNQLFSIVRKQVMLNSDQTPEYGDIRKAGHDGGDFIFVSK